VWHSVDIADESRTPTTQAVKESAMQAYDMIVIALLVFATIWGARRGFAKQLATLLSLILGYVVAVNFREAVAPMIDAPHPWNHFAAMLGLFMATSLLVWIGFRFVNGTIEKSGLEAFDVQMGGLFGLAKGFLIAMLITMFSVVLLGDAQRNSVLGSFSGYNMCRLINRAHRFVPEEWQQAMGPYLQTVEEHPNFAQQNDNSPFDNVFADPLEATSPSDSQFDPQLSQYEDPNFGLTRSGTRASSEWVSPTAPQARLQEPVFDR